MLLKHPLEQELSKAAIARQLGVSRRVVYHWIATGQLERDLNAPPAAYRAAPRVTKLDPNKAFFAARLDSYPALSAVRLHAEITATPRPQGGLCILRRRAG